VKLETQELLEKIQASLKSLGKRVPLSSAWCVVQEAVASTVLSIERNIGNRYAGAEKKALAMARIERIVDVIVAFIYIPYVPLWINSLIAKYIKMFLMQVADGSIDAIVSTFHEVGVFEPKSKEGEE